MTKVQAQANARMAQDAWAVSVTRQRTAEDAASAAWTMESMAKARTARMQQEAAWKAWQAAERRVEEAA